MAAAPASLAAHVSSLLSKAAEEAILPHFRALRASDISEKQPGEIVTVADRAAEKIITRGLSELMPGAFVIGEESAAANPEILNFLKEDLVWLVDPLDGTANFAAGLEEFAVMAALLRGGVPVLAVILHPVTQQVFCAERGAGAFCGDQRLRTAPCATSSGRLRGALMSRFIPAEVQPAVARQVGAVAQIVPGLMCAGLEYPRIAEGERNFAIYWRTLPWDHVPGSLFLTEAGGCVTRWDGSDYRPSDGRDGLVATNDPAAQARLVEALRRADINHAS